jgi:DNA-binding ferritin-like protein
MPTQTRKRKQKQDVVIQFMEMLIMVKLYHWKTSSYAVHKATDELYTKLNEDIDRFIETLLGHSGGSRIHMTQRHIRCIDISSLPELKKEVEKYKRFLNTMQLSNDLSNIRDEIVGNLNQFLYLLSFQ